MDTLQKIVQAKKRDLKDIKTRYPIQELENKSCFNRTTYSLKKRLKNEEWGIIAEFKRKSPSKGIINDRNHLPEVVKGYEIHGASAVSVLTNLEFFGGTNDDLAAAREICNLPLLRKEFIVDEYQIIESKSIGADIILLIAAVLSKDEVKSFSGLAKNLGLEILFEIHSRNELEKYNDQIDIVGINNRNLRDFSVDIEHSIELLADLPAETMKISESGIDNPFRVLELKKAGFNGFLIGESFMRSDDPGKALQEFIFNLEVNNEQ